MRYRRKPIEVTAVQLKSPMTMEVDDSTVERGRPGDYMITFDEGDHAFLSKEAFDRDYEPADAGKATILDHGGQPATR